MLKINEFTDKKKLLKNIQDFMEEYNLVIADKDGHEISSFPEDTTEFCLLKNQPKYRNVLFKVLKVRDRRPLLAFIRLAHPKVWTLYFYGIDNVDYISALVRIMEKRFCISVCVKIKDQSERYEKIFF
jgi:hypothetical protein